MYRVSRKYAGYSVLLEHVFGQRCAHLISSCSRAQNSRDRCSVGSLFSINPGDKLDEFARNAQVQSTVASDPSIIKNSTVRS